MTVTKTLHKQNAFVLSMAYMSASKPILREVVQDGLREYEGKKHIRTSQDNGKTWTVVGVDDWEEQRGERTARRDAGNFLIDRKNNVVIQFILDNEYGPEGDYHSFGPEADGMPLQSRTGRIFYRFSRDEGATWTDAKQLIQDGPDYDSTHWADGLVYGRNAVLFSELMRAVQLRDGTLIVPISYFRVDDGGRPIAFPDRFGMVKWPSLASATFRGQWNEDQSDIRWEMSNHVSVPEQMSYAIEEPSVAELDDGKLMMVMRGTVAARQFMPGVKFFSISQDQAKTWGPAVPLTYPDGSLVHSPSSVASMFRSSKNGKVYMIANILPEPCRTCDPRYPLKVVEIDQNFFWALPETETTIADREPQHPRFVRFSNWQLIEDHLHDRRQNRSPVRRCISRRDDRAGRVSL
jgi:hypothetical protein